MRFKLIRRFEDANSMVGSLLLENDELWTLERTWNYNIAGESCIPSGFYVLEPHNGEKYKNTFALIGEQVSHVQEPGIARSACAVHWARHGGFLAGCVSFSMHLRRHNGYATGDDAVPLLLDALKLTKGPHYLTITYTTELREKMSKAGHVGF